MYEKGLIRNFSPAWFSMIMGTGGLANVMSILGKTSSLANGLSVFLWVFNTFLFVALLIPWSIRWFAYRQQAYDDLKSPLLSTFFVTMPAGCMVLGSNFLLIGSPYLPANFLTDLGLTLWVAGILLAFTLGMIGMYHLTIADRLEPDPINFSWLMMPVVNIIAPLLGNLLIPPLLDRDPGLAHLVNLLDMVFYGIGLILFIIMAVIIINRLILHKLPPAAAAPTFWVLLGPIGLSSGNLMGLADIGKITGLLPEVSTLKFIALLIWGFGLWAFVFTLAITAKYLRSGGIPFSLTWWAFIFPLAAYTSATFSVFDYIGLAAVKWYAGLLAGLLLAIWLLALIKTLLSLPSGKLFAPPPQ